mmetsp:Transcript_25895/g.50596  ORF Transcript_25895/g.50596 Transcript_25895/m.50596 type:complete len:89 (-) Transcript_25895:7-273(-)|eukprot:CAMPEP_0173376982 /NCGR_PEP_ID=MMETSP1356-20130122/140_1 /TAXON_ID=77927 ORGANISM="Hemiselmis virescens, Strain PCC157" /NCGR_SAMPLE_ID=MMETSP1356 /ASSEMBLY_ACC=CAM_ASM_000847 /LENGTH=88 /DNA_ID=CAMNT_0014329569 /DNA_START=152 /DNA_END=418 /DNA_ORIENTATION=+
MTIQAVPPFLLIAGGVAGIGACLGGVNAIFRTNKPSDGPIQFKYYVGMDTWDYDMSMRDAKIFREGIADPSQSKAAWWDFKAPKKVKE